ncbi:MAG: RNA methyltransferase [Clostridia bacterium]|nr:RNA methyltransferase [Clostridia bacterium]
MDFSYVTSKENKLIKSVRKLMTSTRERKTTGTFVLEGLRLCADAAYNGYTVETIIVADSVEETEKLSLLYNSAKQKVRVPDSIFSYMSDTVTPQGVMCVVKVPDTVFSVSNITCGKYIVLENTADPSNLGAISRTAEALGVSGLIISSRGCDPFSPKSQRAGMGALLRLPIYSSSDVLADIELLRNKGFISYASVVSNADCDVSEVEYPENCLVLIGNEANGLTDEAIAMCDKKITITMKGRAESLNAAAAASIIMWEMTRKDGVK